MGQQILKNLDQARIFEAFLVLVLAGLAAKLVGFLLELLSERVPRARFTFKMLVPVARLVIAFFAALTIFRIFAPTPESQVAVLASLSIALGVGGQDLVKNLFGGLVIITDQPFQIGDRVQIGEAYGEITYIGLRSTKLVTPNDTLVTIPNSEILTRHIFNNNSGVPDCQVAIDLYLAHDVNAHEARQVALEAVHSSPYLLTSKPVVCAAADVLDQRPYLKLTLKAYVFDHRQEPAFMTDVVVRAKQAFRERGWNGAG